MTGHSVGDTSSFTQVSATEFAAGLRRRNLAFRTRVLQTAILAALIEHPVSPAVAAQVGEFAGCLGVDDQMLALAQQYAEGSRGLALIDFDRSGYTDALSPTAVAALHTSQRPTTTWAPDPDDPALVARWAGLEHCADGSLGQGVWRFYNARGFRYPGESGSAPPYLAQHDWVHVLADYGSTVESELEVFGFIARATDDPRGFALLAMVIGLFETGQVKRAAGLFRGQPRAPGGAYRDGGPTRRCAPAGALTRGDQALMERDWFADADRQIDDVRATIGVVAKSSFAVAAGSVGPFDAGSLSPYQWQAGHELAAQRSRDYNSYGASVANIIDC